MISGSNDLSFCAALTALSKASNTWSPWKSLLASRLLSLTSAILISSVATFTASAAFACSAKATLTFPSASTIFACAAATFASDCCDTFVNSAWADSRFFWATSTFRSASSFLVVASLTFSSAFRLSISAFFCTWKALSSISLAFFKALSTVRSALVNWSWASFFVVLTSSFALSTDRAAHNPAPVAKANVTAKIAEPALTLRSAFCFASSKMIALSSAVSLAWRSASNLRLLSTISISRLSRKNSSSASLSRLPRANSSAFFSASPRNKKPSFCSAPCHSRNAEP